MEANIRLIVIFSYLIIGISHLIQPLAWVEFFKKLLTYGKIGAFVNGFITLPIALLIVGFHQVWTGWAILVSVLGYAHLIKAAMAFCFPDHSLQNMKRVSVERVHEFQIAGAVLLVLVAIIGGMEYLL